MKTQPCALWGHQSASVGLLNRESWVHSLRQEQVMGTSLQALSPSQSISPHWVSFSTSESPVPPQTLLDPAQLAEEAPSKMRKPLPLPHPGTRFSNCRLSTQKSSASRGVQLDSSAQRPCSPNTS